MRPLLTIPSPFLLAILSCGLATAAEPEFSLTISVTHDSFKAGEEVKLKILLTNLTEHQIGLESLPGVEFEYSFDVLDSQSRKAPLTRYGRALNGTPDTGDERHDCGDCSGFSQELEPHEKITDEIAVSKIYDLTRAGKYTIQVSRPQGDSSHTIVKSNTITVIISD